MSENLTSGKVIAYITAQCRKIVRQQSSGISDVKWDTATHSLIFTLTNGKTVSVPITASASGITYSNTQSKLNANDVQGAIDEVLTTLKKSISDSVEFVALLNDQNDFTGINNFNAETNFNENISVNEHNADIHNGTLNITDNTNNKDIVTKYTAEEIIMTQNNEPTDNVLTFPKETGTFVTSKKFDTKHSVVRNRDTDSIKEDVWFTDDAEASMSMTHENSTTNTSVSVQKGYAEMSAYDFGELTNNSRVSVTSNAVNIYSADATTPDAKTTQLTITPDGAKVNGKDIPTEDDLSKKLDIVETPSSFVKLYGIQKDGSQTLVNVDESINANSTNPVQNKVIKKALDDKLNVLDPSEVNRVYARKTDGLDSSLPFTYTAEGNSIVYRNASGQTQVETPIQDDDAVNKKYADGLQKYLSLSGESGTLEDSQYELVTGYDNLIIQRSGVDFRRCGYPANGQGVYTFISPYYSKPNGTEEFDAYIIIINTDKTWTSTIKNFLMIGEQTYAPFVELTPDSATNGNLSDDDFDNLTSHDDVYIKLNKEYYRVADDGHTPGIRSYTHNGWNGDAPQDKSINITLSTKAWTLAIGKTKYYRHYIQLTVDTNKALYYDFSSTQSEAYTATTLPAMPDDIITAFQIVVNHYYSSVSGLVYKDSLGTLKVVVHGMYTSDGTTMSYLQLTGSEATFVKDVVVKV